MQALADFDTIRNYDLKCKWLLIVCAAKDETRYGRVAFAFHPPARGAAAFAVRVNVSLPPSFAAAAPAGGVRVRLRAPLAHAGRLSRVTVGGAAWAGFSAAEESIDFAAAQLTAGLLGDGLPRIVATFAAAAAAPLRPARARTAHVPHVHPAPQAGEPEEESDF